jgi:hypothetical protein
MKITVQPGQDYFKISGLNPGQTIEIVAGNANGEAEAVKHTEPASTEIPAIALVSY